MEHSPLTKLAGIGMAAALLLALMWLFALGQVTDGGVSQTAAAIDEQLARGLDPTVKTRVTMQREGTGIDAPRRYVVRFRASKAVGADPSAVTRLCERAAQVVVSRLERVRGPVQVHCVAERDGEPAQRCFALTGDADARRLVPVEPVPELPAAPPAEER